MPDRSNPSQWPICSIYLKEEVTLSLCRASRRIFKTPINGASHHICLDLSYFCFENVKPKSWTSDVKTDDVINLTDKNKNSPNTTWWIILLKEVSAIWFSVADWTWGKSMAALREGDQSEDLGYALKKLCRMM